MNITTTSREVANQMCLDALTVLMITSAALMRGTGKENHSELYEAHCDADQQAMHCAHALMDEHPFVASVIQDARMAATLACIDCSPAVYALRRSVAEKKTYLAVNLANGLIKIGASCSPEYRMRSLQTGAASIPELLLVIDDDIERKLHKKFKALRVFGEWFKDDGSITAFIADNKAAKG